MPTTEMVGFRIPVRKTEPKAKSSAAVLVNVGICHTGLFPYLRPYFCALHSYILYSYDRVGLRMDGSTSVELIEIFVEAS